MILLLGFYLYWWTISPRGCHLPSSQCFCTDIVYYISMILLLSFYLYWWTISPQGCHLPSSQCSAMTWFIRYIYYWNLKFLNNVIINQTKFLLPQTYVTWACLGPLILLLPKLKLFGFPIFQFWVCLMKVIPETCGVHQDPRIQL
jgi:hypothetical protein